MVMSDEHKRWRVWPIARGAYGVMGGHFHILGFTHSWTDFCQSREFALFGIFAIKREVWHGEPNWSWAFGKITIRFHSAHQRYYEAEKERKRRAYRRSRALTQAQGKSR